MKVKKQHRKKKYLHTVNRKRLRNKLRSTGTVQCEILKEAWDDKKTTIRNLNEMGLAADPNKVIKIPNFKREHTEKLRLSVKPESDEDNVEDKIVPLKKQVAEELEKQARAPRKRKFMLPKGQVEFLTYLLDKYGHDYKAMAKDKKNYYQETWKQLRAKIKTFMGIPKQYGDYLQSRGLVDNVDDKELKEQAKHLVEDDSD